MAGVIFVSRHPDHATEIVTQGFDSEPHVIAVDLGSSFDIGHGIGGEDEIESAWSIIGEMQAELLDLDDGEVRRSVEQTRDMLLEEVEHVERTILITNAYEDEVVTATATIAVRRPTDPVFGDEAEYLQYLNDDLVIYTGTGRTEGNATYEIESVDDLEPKIDLSWG